MTLDEVKSLSEAQLPELAESVRRKIIDSVAANGGHLAASLGTVEISFNNLYLPPT